MSRTSKKYLQSRLVLLNLFIVFLALAGIFSSCGSKKKLHHHVLHVNDLYLGKDTTSAQNPDYDTPKQNATRYGVKPVD